MFLEVSAFRKVVGRYGKSSGKGQARNAYGLDMNSAPELYRHDPLARADRSQSPETVIAYTYDFKKPIEYHPHNNPTANGDRGDQTPHIVPHTSPTVQAAYQSLHFSHPQRCYGRRNVFCKVPKTHAPHPFPQISMLCVWMCWDQMMRCVVDVWAHH